ncbi:MAG: S8 family serine peptidase [Solirubrobacteraceae bacterium]
MGVAVSLFAALLFVQAAAARERSVRVVVMGDHSVGDTKRAVRAAGGSVEHVLRIVNGVVARVPAGSLASIEKASGVRGVAVNRRFSTRSDDLPEAAPETTEELSPEQIAALASPGDAEADETDEDAHPADEPDAEAGPDDDVGLSLAEVRRTIGANRLDSTGSGVDIALIDSGVSPVAGLDGAGKVVNGADFSHDYSHRELRNLDAYGHGTHLAGIIAGHDEASGFTGVAPGARLINVKVAEAEGTTSLIQLMLAIDWVVRNRTANGMNIRVLTLAVGDDNRHGYQREPLAWAVEQAWSAGIVVVTAAGNDGNAHHGLDLPAADPYVIAVGGVDAQGTADPADDEVADWSSRGNHWRDPDFAAPGDSIVSLRVPGSFLDERYPAARMSDTRFRGSGTSQAAAAATGAVALLLSSHPSWNPDTVTAALRRSARSLGADHRAQGEGSLDVAAADASAPTGAVQTWPRARSFSMRDLARRGRDDINVWDGRRWSGRRWSGRRWSGLEWTGVRWNGVKW